MNRFFRWLFGHKKPTLKMRIGGPPLLLEINLKDKFGQSVDSENVGWTLSDTTKGVLKLSGKNKAEFTAHKQGKVTLVAFADTDLVDDVSLSIEILP